MYSVGEKRALSVLAGAAALALGWMAHPIAVGLFLGVLSAFTVQPMYRLRARFRAAGSRVDWAALVCVAVAGVVCCSASRVFFTLLVSRGAAVAGAMPRVSAAAALSEALTHPLTHQLARVHAHRRPAVGAARRVHGAAATRATVIAAPLAGATFDGLLGLFFLLLSMHFALVHWETLTHRVESMLPLNPGHTRQRFGGVSPRGSHGARGHTVMRPAQGGLAASAMRITGVSSGAAARRDHRGGVAGARRRHAGGVGARGHLSRARGAPRARRRRAPLGRCSWWWWCPTT
ncbi:MAG: hypothetical protein U0325_36575 [Polyangiales bacterium]